MQKLRKTFASAVMLMTILSMSLVATVNVQAATAGDLVKVDGASAVYYLGADSKLYVFPNQDVFFSWYSDFNSVVTISATELNSYGAPKANIVMRAGTRLIKRPIPTAPEVFAVEPNGTLRWIDSEATAITLYGNDWATRVVDVVDSFFTNYKGDDAKTNKVTAAAYPAGSLIKAPGDSNIYYIDTDGKARLIANEAAFDANRFKWSDVVTAATGFTMPAMGAEITGALFNDTSQGGGSGTGITPGAGTGLTVALASDTPAATTILATPTQNQNGQAMVPFTKLNFTASADGDVKVTNLKFKRTGISNDTDMDNLYLYDGASRLTDGVNISSGIVTFNNASGLFTVPAGTTKAITLKGDVNYDASSGKTIGFQVESASTVTTNGAAVNGSFPLSGNLMSTADVTDLGRLTLNNYATPGTDNTSITPSETEQEVWKTTLQSNEQALSVEKLIFTAVGSIQKTDLKNFKLYVNSVAVATVEGNLDANNQVIFDLSAAPIAISKGSSKTVSLRATLIGGSTREFYFSFQNSNDIVVKDTNYNVYIQPYTGGSWSVIKPTGDYYVAAGSLSVSKSTTSPTTNVVVDGTNVVLGIWDFKASGEDIKIKDLNILANTSSYGGLDNGKVYVNDTQVGTTKDLTEDTNVNFTFGSTFIVKAGETAKVKVIADIKTTTSTSYAGTENVTVSIATGSSNAQRQVSLGTFNAPDSAVAANQLNIIAAGVTVTKYTGFGSQTVVAGTSKARLGSFAITAGASEGIDVSSITIALSAEEAATITNMYLADAATGAQIGDVKVTPASGSNIFSVSISLAASNAKVVDLYADVKSGANSGTWIANIDADGTGKVTGNAVSADALNIQTVTIGSGTLNVYNGSQPASEIILAGSQNNKMAEFLFKGTNESFTIEELNLKMANDFATSTADIKVKYTNQAGTVKTVSGLLVATAGDAIATFTGLDIYAAKGVDTKVEVYVDTAAISSSGHSGASTAIYFDYNTGFRAVGSSGAVKTAADNLTADLNGSTFYSRKTKPTFATQTLTGSPAGGVIYRFTVVADAKGQVDIKQLGFEVTTTAATVNDMYLYDVDNQQQVTDTGVDADGSGFVKLLVGGVDDDVLNVGTTARTFEVRGTVAGWASGASITAKFKKDTAVTDAAANAQRGTYYNVWSDRSDDSHTTATSDWTSGYLLKNMDTAQSFTQS